MKYISPAFFKFFDELSQNNNKEWFDTNRDRYENDVKKPFRALVEKLIEELSKDLPEINLNPSKCIFRINRDIRFAKDKSPYKNNVAAVFNQKGTKDVDYPGFYIHIGQDELMIGGGKYFCSKQDLEKIRQEIYYNHSDFKKLINDKKFKSAFGELQGEKSKVLPPDYKAFEKTEPLIANKQFWFYKNLTRKEVLVDDFDKVILAHFRSALKMNNFLWETVSA